MIYLSELKNIINLYLKPVFGGHSIIYMLAINKQFGKFHNELKPLIILFHSFSFFGKSCCSKICSFKIDFTTQDKKPECKKTCDPTAVLSEEEEIILENWILECSLKEFPRRKEDLQLSVKLFLDKNERPNPFKNN